MGELLRVFNKKTFITMIVLCLIDFMIVGLSAGEENSITIEGEELQAYIEKGYPEFVRNTIGRGKMRLGLELYSDGYSSQQIAKTIALYEGLKDIRLEPGDNRGVLILLESDITWLLLFFFMFCVMLSFFEERKKGLDFMIRSLKKGRTVLYLERIGVLFVMSFIGTVLLHGASFLASSMSFGTGDLSRNIQSIPEFMGCPLDISIGEYFLILCVTRGLMVFFLSFFSYIILALFGTFAAYVVIIAVAAVEALLRILVPAASSFGILRLINIYTVLKANDLFKSCVFVNLFGNAMFGIKAAAVVFGLVFIILFTIGIVLIGRMYTKKISISERAQMLLGRFKEKTAFRHTVFGWECYKVLVKQGALFIILAVLFLHIKESGRYDYFFPIDGQTKLMYLKYGGDAVSTDSYESAKNTLEIYRESERILERKMQELLIQIPFDGKKYSECEERLELTRRKRLAIEPVVEDIKSCVEYSQSSGNEVWLIEPYAYEILLVKDRATIVRAAFLILICIIGSLSGIYAYERQTGVLKTIRSTFRGRFTLIFVKPAIVTLLPVMCVLMFSLVQVVNIDASLGLNDLDKPVQGIYFLRDFPLYISVRSYLALIIAARCLAGIAAGIVVAVISCFSSDKFSAMGKALIIFGATIVISAFYV